MFNTISLKHNTTNILNILKNEAVFVLALVLAVISSFVSTPKIEYIDFKVLFTLFNLMLVVGGLGTLISSLASVISYKLYVNECTDAEKKKYLSCFTFYNFISLLLFAFIIYFLFIF